MVDMEPQSPVGLQQVSKNLEKKFKFGGPPIYKDDLVKEYEEQNKEYALMALDHYNATNEGPKYELVESFGSYAFLMCGLWMHVCFLAKPILSSSSSSAIVDADTSPKHFFAEVARPAGKQRTIFCCIVDPNSPATMDGCGRCRPYSKLYHPKDGLEAGNYPYEDRSFPMPDNYYDADVPEERRIRASF